MKYKCNYLVLFVIICSCVLQIGKSLVIPEDESFIVNPRYPNQNELEIIFRTLRKINPSLVKDYSIGKSLEGRKLIAIEISESVENRAILKPMVKFSANMHGDEPIGRQMLIYLAAYLVLNYGKVPAVTKLINETDIHLLPTINPDGYAKAKEGHCDSLNGYVGRTNAAGVDLNRDFPDRLEDQRTIQMKARRRQPETAALVNWITTNPFVLSANFHGGAVVASYPYDNSITHHDCCAESLTPDDQVFKLMAHTYADNHPVMRTGRDCNETFPNGVTNGAYWYELNGGMQDFNYAFTNCFELTIELSCCKFPLASTLPEEWQKNKRSLLELVKLAHIGVKGLVKDINGYPIRDAKILVEKLEDKPILTTERGEYWRLLTPGTYNIQAVAFGYEPSNVETIEIKNNSQPLRLDFKLKPAEAIDGPFRHELSERAKKGELGFVMPTKFEHHNTEQLEKFIRDLSQSYPSITRMYSIGKSVKNRDLWVLEIAKTPGKHVPGIPEFKYVANMHGNEVVGREMLVYLSKLICENYLLDNRITKLVNRTRMHFLFSMNPDGYDIAIEGDHAGGTGRANINGVDLNRNFPDQYGTNKLNAVAEPETLAVMNWTLSIPFVLSGNLHGGALVANYPFDDSPQDFYSSTNYGNHIKNPTQDEEMFKYLAKVYSHAHPTMKDGKPCPLFPHEHFADGITNGAKWYSVTGGMQDWNYVHAGVFELTIEMGCDKFPFASELERYWKENREPLIKFIEQVRHGVHGFIRSSIGTPVPGASILLDDMDYATYSATYGDYWKLATPGTHNITVIADGFEPHRQLIEIPSDGDNSLRLDISLMRDDPQHWASAHDYRIIENVVRTRYHSNQDIKEEMSEFDKKNVQIASFEFGDSEVSMEYHQLKLTSELGSPEEKKFKILILSSIFGGVAPIGREITMNLARHVVEGFKIQDPPIVKLLNRSVLHFVPVMQDYEAAFTQYTQNASVCDPFVPEDLAERILSPEPERRRDLLLQMLKSENFDLILSFSTGGGGTYYPESNDNHVSIYENLSKIIEKTEFNLKPIQCPLTSMRSHQKDAVQRVTNLLYNIYSIPMFTLDISCCRMPPPADIAVVWRRNIEKIVNFLHLIDTGFEGVVRDEAGQPLRNATVRISDHSKIYEVTKNLAHFHIALPKGAYGATVMCPDHMPKKFNMDIVEGVFTDIGNVVLRKEVFVAGKSEFHEVSLEGKISTAAISGFILDVSNHPITNAKISVINPSNVDIKTFTDKIGSYILKNVPMGDVTLQVEAPGHISATRLIHVGTLGEAVRGVVFRLTIDERVWGLPRLFFIISAGCVLLLIVVCCAFCVQVIKARDERTGKRDYSFSLLPQRNKELFADEDLDETELFTSPIKKGVRMQPYYDDERDPIIDTDDDDSQEEEDIVMLERKEYCD